MHSSGVYRTANTLRITLPKYIVRALELLPKQRVVFTHTRPGVVEIQNADKLVELARRQKR